MEIKKSEKANIENGKSTALLIGFVMILALLFVALEWTQREKEIDISGMVVAEISLEEEMIPITLPEKKTVPPPPQSVTHAEVIEIVEDDAEIEETILASTEDQTEFIDISEVENIVVEEEPQEEAPFMVVEDMPQFPGGDAALMEYLSKNIKYPAIAEENGVQGRVIVTFVVERDGSITDVKVVKSVDPSLDREAARVVKSMPHWIPGKQNGSAVRVKYTVPVTFKLQ